MVFGKMWRALKAQVNKVANWFSGVDPVAQLQYEYDRSVEQLKEGREGLAQYRALVERVTRQVEGSKKQVVGMESRIKAYLQAGDRETAAKFALEHQKAKQAHAENVAQLQMHEQAYENHLTKIKHAAGKLAELQQRIHKYDAELKMSRAEAEMAKLAQTFNFDVTTDFGQVEDIIQTRIDRNRAQVRVAVDLSGEGVEEIRREQAAESAMADQALLDFEKELGLPQVEAAPPPKATVTTSGGTKALP